MADGYKEFGDAEWKIGGANGGGGRSYTDMTLNKANGVATLGARPTDPVSNGAHAAAKPYHSVPGNTSMLPKAAQPTPDPFGPPSNSSGRLPAAGGGGGGKGGGRGWWARHWRLVTAVVLVALVAAVALGAGLGAGLNRNSSSSSSSNEAAASAAAAPEPAASPAEAPADSSSTGGVPAPDPSAAFASGPNNGLTDGVAPSAQGSLAQQPGAAPGPSQLAISDPNTIANAGAGGEAARTSQGSAKAG